MLVFLARRLAPVCVSSLLVLPKAVFVRAMPFEAFRLRVSFLLGRDSLCHSQF